ncbi:protein-glutamate O-methyltransferase CheR [bacterium]|nr:protein-glutamate O-methyltransferase CheR [bacterium]
MNSDSFEYIKKFVGETAAIMVEPGKEYFVENRLMPVVRAEGMQTIEQLVNLMQNRPFGTIHHKVVDAMTTNETLFFRDIYPFESLKKIIIPELIQKRANEKALNIWCGASSSGQEPYSLALLLRETFPQLKDWRITFIASDISDSMLERCKAGVYTQLEVNRGLPAIYLAKYFEKSGPDWKLKDDIKKMVDFKKINLVGNWPLMPKMDIVLVRNVLIYFDVDVKKAILKKVRELMKPDGYFFLGGGETTLMLDDNFDRLNLDRVSCYTIKSSV